MHVKQSIRKTKYLHVSLFFCYVTSLTSGKRILGKNAAAARMAMATRARYTLVEDPNG